MILRNLYLSFQGLLNCVNTQYVASVNGTFPSYHSVYTMWGIGNDSDGQYPSMYKVRTSYASYGGVIFGDGDTPVRWDDRKLSGNVISTITASANITKSTANDGAEVTGLYTITNTGSTDITIREVGLMANARSIESADYAVLIERTLLEEPLTIPAGGVGQVTYTVKFNAPTA